MSATTYLPELLQPPALIPGESMEARHYRLRTTLIDGKDCSVWCDGCSCNGCSRARSEEEEKRMQFTETVRRGGVNARPSGWNRDGDNPWTSLAGITHRIVSGDPSVDLYLLAACGARPAVWKGQGLHQRDCLLCAQAHREAA